MSKILQPYEFVEVEPCLVKGRFLGWDRYDPTRFVQEVKYNGERRIVQFIDGKAYFTGRRRSVSGELLEKGANLYHLRDSPHELDGAIIDGEIYIPGGVSSDMTSIMGTADPVKAQEKIMALPKHPRYAVFDILAMPGRQYITRRTLRERRVYMVELSSLLRIWTEHTGSDIAHPCIWNIVSERSYDAIVAGGGEGVVIKDLESRYVYGSCGAWTKVKPEREGTVTMIGVQQGEGKYADTLGAIIFGGVLEGRRVSGTVSGMTDLQRDEVWENPLPKGKKFDVIYERITPEGKLIHARFDRWRDDI